MKLNPFFDQIIVVRATPATESSGGIIIPDNVTEKADQGIVTAVGPGRRTEAGLTIPIGVSIGDRVLFNVHAGQAVKILGEEVLVLREEDIIGIIQE